MMADKHWSLSLMWDIKEKHKKRHIWDALLPVDSSRALVGLDVHLVVVDVHLWDLHLKIVGQQLDGLAHGAHAWPAGGMEHLLQGWGENPHGHCTERGRRDMGEDR